jgi:hypothetical protein
LLALGGIARFLVATARALIVTAVHAADVLACTEHHVGIEIALSGGLGGRYDTCIRYVLRRRRGRNRGSDSLAHLLWCLLPGDCNFGTVPNKFLQKESPVDTRLGFIPFSQKPHTSKFHTVSFRITIGSTRSFFHHQCEYRS